jgi:hypothetical protein
MNDRRPVDRLRVAVDGEVDPHLLAAAIRRRVAGDAWPAGPERVVADAVLDAVTGSASRVGGSGRIDGRAARWR